MAAWYSPQHAHDLLRLRGLGERGEAAQVEEDDDDLAPVALERIVGAPVDDRLGERRRKERLSRDSRSSWVTCSLTRCSSVRSAPSARRGGS